MYKSSYHNSNNLSGNDLKQAVANCKKQEDAVLMIYLNTRLKWSASDIHKALMKAGFQHPITSTRRAITNLLTDKHLVKMKEQKKGLYNMNEAYYQINPAKYPTPTSTQSDLFNLPQQNNAA